MKIYFNNNFYFTKFIYLFHVQNLNHFVNFKTPVVKRWLIRMKRMLSLFYFFHVSYLWLTARLLKSIVEEGGQLQRYDSIFSTI